ncbi:MULTISPECIES: DUF6801 domain-containing protein [unclassified Nocardioides]|uniref:DUF6801 domain-containing protein n=1 Tax=unclassified Nocardioides TaxID=2615069 RepID=UPI003015066B
MTTRITSRLAALGAALAVGSAGLVAVSPSAQAAVSGKADYTCQTSFGPQVVTVTTKAPLPKKVKKGKKVPAKTVVLKVVLSPELATALRGFGITSLSGNAAGAKATVGKTKVALKNVAFKDQAVPASGAMTIKASGKTAAFKLRKRGTQVVKAPTKFKFSAQDQNGNALISNASCSLNPGENAKIGKIKVR